MEDISVLKVNDVFSKISTESKKYRIGFIDILIQKIDIVISSVGILNLAMYHFLLLYRLLSISRDMFVLSLRPPDLLS